MSKPRKILILNLDLEPNPLIALFGTSGKDDMRLTPTKSRTLSFASLLARRAILLRWRDAAQPTHTQWLRDIMSCLDLEKIRYSVCDSSKKFQKVWGPFLKYFEKLKSNWSICPSFLWFLFFLVHFSQLQCLYKPLSKFTFFYLFTFIYLSINPVCLFIYLFYSYCYYLFILQLNTWFPAVSYKTKRNNTLQESWFVGVDSGRGGMFMLMLNHFEKCAMYEHVCICDTCKRVRVNKNIWEKKKSINHSVNLVIGDFIFVNLESY